jgi:hypothetical protein
VAAILDPAARFAEQWRVPLNDLADAQGCRLVEGRAVMTAPGHRAAWDAFVADGFGARHGGAGDFRSRLPGLWHAAGAATLGGRFLTPSACSPLASSIGDRYIS